MFGYIYITTNKINGKIYIGQHKSEKYDENYLGSGKYLGRAIQKYGKENFENYIIEWCKDKKELCEKEKYWIRKYNTLDNSIGYNITPGGEFGDITTGMTEEDYEKWREKLKISHQGLTQSDYTKQKRKEKLLGEKNPMFGKPGTNLGKKFSKEHKEKIRNANTGKKHSEETRMKISASHKGKKLSENHILSIKNRLKENHPFKGKKHSEESKKKMSLNGSGNKSVIVTKDNKFYKKFRNLNECFLYFEKLGLDRAIIKKNLRNISPIYFDGMKSNKKSIIDNRKLFFNYNFSYLDNTEVNE